MSNSEPLQQRIAHAEQSHTTGRPDASAHDNTDCCYETYVEATLGDSYPLGVEEQKVLGVRSRPSNDQFVFDIISIVGRFYDPLGFLAPVTIRFKYSFRSCVVARDEPLPEELILKWKALVKDLHGSIPLSIPRCYLASHEGAVTSRFLCGFCDASTQAYAAVTYLITRTENNIEVSFITAKTRVAPLQSQTIPRLELLSALLLARLITTVADSLASTLPQLKLRCSKVALYWIQGVDKEWKPFVRNRVVEIRQKVPPERWFHCPGETNPADLPSRGLSLLELSVNTLWRRGPEWLRGAGSFQCDPEVLATPDE